METPTGKTIAAYWTRATEGARVTCTGNTRTPAVVGLSGIITKPGKTSIRVTLDDGRHRWLSPPRAVRDTLSIDGDTITYRIDGADTVTYRIALP